MDKWLTDWLTEWMNDWLTDWQTDWLTDWMNEWMNKRMNEWMNEWMTEWMNDWMNEWMNESTNQSIKIVVINFIIVSKPLAIKSCMGLHYCSWTSFQTLLQHYVTISHVPTIFITIRFLLGYIPSFPHERFGNVGPIDGCIVNLLQDGTWSGCLVVSMSWCNTLVRRNQQHGMDWALLIYSKQEYLLWLILGTVSPW